MIWFRVVSRSIHKRNYFRLFTLWTALPTKTNRPKRTGCNDVESHSPDPNRYTPMLKKSRYIALFSIFLLIGCRDNPNKHQNHFKEYDITCRSYETELYGRFPYLLTVDSLLISVAAEGSGGRIGRIYSIDDKPQEIGAFGRIGRCLLYTSPSPRD